MFLKLLESRRARRFAGGALAASVAVHALTVGAAARPPGRGSGTAGEEGPISIRYLLPPNRVAQPVGERIQFVAVGPGTTGWAGGADRSASAPPEAGSREPAEATRPLDVDEGAPTEVTELFTEDQVDSVAVRDPASGAPSYPDQLRAEGVQGQVLVEFTVDTTGHADPGSFTVVESTHPLFAQAVRDALPTMLFTPAVAHGRRVRQLVRLPMRFKLVVADKGTA